MGWYVAAGKWDGCLIDGGGVLDGDGCLWRAMCLI